jgi:hypothetical protein
MPQTVSIPTNEIPQEVRTGKIDPNLAGYKGTQLPVFLDMRIGTLPPVPVVLQVDRRDASSLWKSLWIYHANPAGRILVAVPRKDPHSPEEEHETLIVGPSFDLF